MRRRYGGWDLSRWLDEDDGAARRKKGRPRGWSLVEVPVYVSVIGGLQICHGALGHPPPDSPTLDSSEHVCISSLALLKMLKHCKAGVPIEVPMGPRHWDKWRRMWWNRKFWELWINRR